MPEVSEEDLKSLNEAKTELGTLKGTMEGLNKDVGNLKAAKDGLERKLDDADKELLSENYLDYKSKKGKSTVPEGGGGEDSFDYDRASGKEVAAHLEGKSKAQLEAAIKGIATQIEETEAKMGKAFAQIDVTLASIRHADFEPNKDAIYAIAKANQSWGAEKCYSQWKLESKAADDKKKSDADEKVKEDAKVLTEKGGGVIESLTQKKELTGEEAASAAYDQSFGNSEKT